MLDPKQIDELKARHGEVHELTSHGITVVVKSPSRASWKRFRAMGADERKRSEAMETLLRDCVVHPDLVAFDGMLDKKPALAEVFGAELVGLAGGGGDVEKKAL